MFPFVRRGDIITGSNLKVNAFFFLMTMFGFLKLKAMHHNIIVIQVLEKVYNVILLASDLYKYKFEAWNMTLYTLGHIKDFIWKDKKVMVRKSFAEKKQKKWKKKQK
jgi:hypothetical protein